MPLSIGRIFGIIIDNWFIALPIVTAIIGLIFLWIVRRRAQKKVAALKPEVNAMIMAKDRRYQMPVKKSEIRDFDAIRPKMIGGKPIYILQTYKAPPPEPMANAEPVLYVAPPKIVKMARRKYGEELAPIFQYMDALADGNGSAVAVEEPTRAIKTARRRYGEELEPLFQYIDQLHHNGHKEAAAVAVAPAYLYEALKLRPVPEKYQDMTPNWLWRRLHWEEQAKFARVKASGLSPAIKLGAAIAVLILFAIVIFLFGTIIAGK